MSRLSAKVRSWSAKSCFDALHVLYKYSSGSGSQHLKCYVNSLSSADLFEMYSGTVVIDMLPRLVNLVQLSFRSSSSKSAI